MSEPTKREIIERTIREYIAHIVAESELPASSNQDALQAVNTQYTSACEEFLSTIIDMSLPTDIDCQGLRTIMFGMTQLQRDIISTNDDDLLREVPRFEHKPHDCD